MAYLPEPKHQHGSIAKTGILLVNLGTPQAPTAAAVRPYLRQFLSDPRVVEISRPLWWLILNLFVLPTRPRKSAQKYALIWT
ncbi:MAG TPA: ferrochelatase, partial [Burkholderiales bacterium]